MRSIVMIEQNVKDKEKNLKSYKKKKKDKLPTKECQLNQQQISH